MKRFKFWLVSVCVLLSGIISFGYCDSLGVFSRGSFDLKQGLTFNFNAGTCLLGSSYFSALSFYDNNGNLVSNGGGTYTTTLYCLDFAGYITSSSSVSHSYYYYTGLDSLGGSVSCPSCPDCPVCPDCPICDNTAHLGIFQGGSLVQGLDSNTGFYNIYLSDGLDFSTTPTAEGQSIYITGYDFSGVSWSELVINDIVHQSAPLIDITIPEEFDWDYTGNENEFTLDIKGFNVDTEYIDGIIRTQKTTPNDTDFNNIITGLIPLLVPGLVIILFIYFIFRFIKKVF